MVAMIQRPSDFGQADAADTQARSCNAGEMTELHYLQPAGHFVIPSYTHVVVSERRRTVYVSGQVAADGEGNVIGVGDYVAQTEQATRTCTSRAHCCRSDLC